MRRLVVLMFIAVGFAACGDGNNAVVQGVFSGVVKDSVWLEMVTTKERTVVDKKITDGKGGFKFKIKLPDDNPTFFNLICKGNVIPLIVAPKEKVMINSLGKLSHNYTVTGSEDSKLLKEFNTLYETGVNQLDSLSALYEELSQVPEFDERRKELLSEYTRIYYKFKQDHIKFIVTNPKSMSAIYALYQRLPNDQSLFNGATDMVYYRVVADSMAVAYPQSPHVKALIKDVEAMENNFSMQAKLHGDINELTAVDFPQIELPDMYGKKHKLSDLVGNVIVLDFWAAKDSRSTVLNAELKEIYAEFADKGMKVYQVSLDEAKPLWVAAVQNQKLPWVTVCDFKGANSVAARNYNISALPSNLVINKQGEIVARNIFGENLKNKVAQLVAQN